MIYIKEYIEEFKKDLKMAQKYTLQIVSYLLALLWVFISL